MTKAAHCSACTNKTFLNSATLKLRALQGYSIGYWQSRENPCWFYTILSGYVNDMMKSLNVNR